MKLKSVSRPATVIAVAAAVLTLGGGTAWACHGGEHSPPSQKSPQKSSSSSSPFGMVSPGAASDTSE